jgi:NADH-quinone oxidoreductase subunit E
MAEIAEILKIGAAEVVGVASFYSMLKLRPKGRNVVSICHNLACSLMGAETLIAALEGKLGIRCGETTPDGEFTLERAECLAACEMAPMIQIDYDQMLGPLTAEQALAKVEELRSQAAAAGEAATAPRPAAVPASAPAGVAAVDKLAQEAPTDAEARWATPGEKPKTAPPGEEPLLIDTIPLSDE